MNAKELDTFDQKNPTMTLIILYDNYTIKMLKAKRRMEGQLYWHISVIPDF